MMDTFFPHLEPLWPLLAIGASALLIVALTVWAYRGVQMAHAQRRWRWLLLLRLAALAVACLILLRPTWQYPETLKKDATIVLLLDVSKSMSTKDEDPSRTRWEALVQEWQDVAGLITRLQEEQNVHVVVYGFDTQLEQFDPALPPGGERTALVKALKEAFDHHRQFDREKSNPLLGIVVVTDGRENVGKPALDSMLAELARAPCPVYTIGMGHPGGAQLQPDLIAQDIQAPAAARVKDRLKVIGTILAQKFVGQDVEVWLRIDGKPVMQADNPTMPARVIVRPGQSTQSIPIEFPPVKLPDQPGDIRVSLWAKPLQDEITQTNNEVSTYMTLTKEGLSVLYFDKWRAWEYKYISKALKGDERITPYFTYLHTDGGDVAERWRREWIENLKNNVYDVFIIGDMPASRFGPELLGVIKQRVEQGAGLLMIGGRESFGDGGWEGTELEPLLPVDVKLKGQLEGAPGGMREIKFVPTDEGLRHFILRLDSDIAKNREWWARLAPLQGGNRVGRKLGGATELARSADGDVLLAINDYRKGRTAALAVDTTWRWDRVDPPDRPQDRAIPEGREAHIRFWRQLILWLAHQEEAGKALRIELAHRRLAAGKEQIVTVQAREVTPGGTKDASRPLQGAIFNVKIIKPDKTEETVTVAPDGGVEGKSQGRFWKTDEPGEYEAQVSATYQGADLGTARARFMTYRDDSELLDRTANHSLLEQIARETGGQARLHGGLREVLEQLTPESATESTRSIRVPDWQESNLPLQALLFALFVALISVEWLLRRLWGLV